MHYPAPPSLPRGFIHSQLAPNSSYFSGSQRSSNSSQKQQPLRPMSAHSRVQRGSFQQQAPRIIPYGKDEMDDDDLDCIFDDDQTGFIETDLDQVRARWKFRDRPPPQLDQLTCTMWSNIFRRGKVD